MERMWDSLLHWAMRDSIYGISRHWREATQVLRGQDHYTNFLSLFLLPHIPRWRPCSI